MKERFASLPDSKNVKKESVTYPLIKGLVYANIKYDSGRKSLIYKVVEPRLEKEEKQKIKKIVNFLGETLDIGGLNKKNRDEAPPFLQKKLNKILTEKKIRLEKGSYAKIMYYMLRDFVGLNRVEPLMHDPYIIDFSVAGLNTPVHLIHKKYGRMISNIVYRDLNYLNNFIIKLSERAESQNFSGNMFYGKLKNGERAEATISKDKPKFSIRKFRMHPLSPVDILASKTASPSMLAYLWFLLDYSKSILISGGEKTGKTTMLNAVSMFIKPELKVLSIEDKREINLPHENWTPAKTGEFFPVSENTVSLLKESFKVNPDYTIVGKLKGEEAYSVFQGIVSGNPMISTIEAHNVDFTLKKMEIKIGLPKSLIGHLDALVVMDNNKVKEILEIKPKKDKIGAVKVFSGSRKNLLKSHILKKIAVKSGASYRSLLQDITDRKKILEWMQKFNVAQHDEFFDLLRLYYKDKEIIMSLAQRNIRPKFD